MISQSTGRGFCFLFAMFNLRGIFGFFAIDEALDNPVKKVTATMASYVQEIHYSTILTPKIAD